MTWEVHVSLLEDPFETVEIVEKYESFLFEDVLSDTGAGHVIVDSDAIDEALLEEDTCWRFLENGVPRGGFLLETVEDVLDDEDPSVRRLKIAGRGFGAMLEWAVVYPFAFDVNPNARKERTWIGRSFPDVLHIFVWEAHERGSIPMLDASSWEDGTTRESTRDSDGQAWGGLIDGETTAGTDLLTLARRWGPLHPFEWHVGADMAMHAWKQAGRNRTEEVVFHPGRSVAKQQVTRVRRGLRNVVLVTDTQGKTIEVTDETSIALWTRREQHVTSEDAINSGTSAAVAYDVLNRAKADQVERVVGVLADEGRRPWVDFGLGDLVSVDYDGTLRPHRCLAIAVGVDKDGKEIVEAVLDTLLSAEPVTASAGVGGGGMTLVYKANEAGVISVGTAPNLHLPMLVEALSVTNARGGLNLYGVASGALTLSIEVMFGAIAAQTFLVQVPTAGAHTAALPWIQVGIPEGAETWHLRLKTTTGTFVIPENRGSWWMESSDLAGGLTASNPDVHVIEPTSIIDAPVDSKTVERQTPVAVDPTADAATVVPVTDSYVVLFGTGSLGAANDGWVFAAAGFDATSNLLQAGNSSGEVREAFIRFDLGADLGGKTITGAFLDLVVDANMPNVVDLEIAAVLATAAAAPVDRAQYDALPLTTARTAWATTAVAGATLRTADFAAVVQEIADAGSLTHLLVVLKDGPAEANQWLTFRASEHGTGPAPRLLIGYE